jgi:hypothetical protein
LAGVLSWGIQSGDTMGAHFPQLRRLLRSCSSLPLFQSKAPPGIRHRGDAALANDASLALAGV